MAARVCILQGHPDSSPRHFVHALAQAYADGARAGGREVRVLAIGDIEFPLLRNREEWSESPPPPDIAAAQESIRWCDHLVVVYPLWLGTMPARLKAFLEQVMRPGFALPKEGAGNPWAGELKGRSARVIVTMGMPALFYRVVYRAHSLKSLERNILGFVGFKPVRSTVIGMVESGDQRREKWLQAVERLGREGR